MRQIRGSCTGALLSPFRFSKINHKLLCLLALLVFLPSLAFAARTTQAPCAIRNRSILRSCGN